MNDITALDMAMTHWGFLRTGIHIVGDKGE